MDIKPYKSKFDYSYTLGAFPTFELIKNQPDKVITVFVSESFTDYDKLKALCNEKKISLNVNDKIINKLSDKGNVYVVGVFRKYNSSLSKNKPHAMFVNPSDMGNMGTILRSALAFSIKDIAIIAPGVDIYNPKVVRASMGSMFHLNIQYFESFEEYSKLYNEADRNLISFMLDANKPITVEESEKPKLFTLIFGNEATGLPEDYKKYTKPVIIPQSAEVDSLNLTIAAGIAMYTFNKDYIK